MARPSYVFWLLGVVALTSCQSTAPSKSSNSGGPRGSTQARSGPSSPAPVSYQSVDLDKQQCAEFAKNIAVAASGDTSLDLTKAKKTANGGLRITMKLEKKLGSNIGGDFRTEADAVFEMSLEYGPDMTSKAATLRSLGGTYTVATRHVLRLVNRELPAGSRITVSADSCVASIPK